MSDAVLRGAGKMAMFMTTTFLDLLLRVVLSIVLSRWLNSPVGVWLSWPIGWVLSSLLSVFFFFHCRFGKEEKQPQP